MLVWIKVGVVGMKSREVIEIGNVIYGWERWLENLVWKGGYLVDNVFRLSCSFLLMIMYLIFVYKFFGIRREVLRISLIFWIKF